MRAEKQVNEALNPNQVQNLVQLLQRRAQASSKVAAAQKVAGQWRDVTWGEVLAEVRRVSAGLLALGLQPGERVAIFASTSLTWLICDLAISAAQGITIPIYSSNTPDETRFILNHSEAAFVFVDHDQSDGKQPGRLSRLRGRLAQCPTIRKVIAFEGPVASEKEIALSELQSSGEAKDRADPHAFDRRVGTLKAEDPWGFIYTSGTTGDPKGVILTHANWLYEADGVEQIGLMVSNDVVFLFLPLAHVFAQVVKAAWLGSGFKLAVDGSVDKVVQHLAEIRPSVLPAVPRIFEKVYNGVLTNGLSGTGIKPRLFRWAMQQFDEYVEARNHGRSYGSLSFALARRLVFAKVKASLDQKLGGNLRLFVSGGAPLSKKIGYFFDLLGYEVLEGYGLTESSAGTTVNRPHRIKLGTVGPPFPGTEVKIAPDGEILFRGPGVMKGYYRNDGATQEALAQDGWLHTGDIGEVDSEGYVRITDRKKDIIVTAAGKNVAPQNLENQLKTHGVISQAMVYGDRRHYLTALVTVAEDAAKKLLSDQGVSAKDYREMARHPLVQQAVQRAVEAVNAEQPPYATLKRFTVLEQDFSQETGELTPTLKVKRKVCTQKYRAALDQMYDGDQIE